MLDTANDGFGHGLFGGSHCAGVGVGVGVGVGERGLEVEVVNCELASCFPSSRSNCQWVHAHLQTRNKDDGIGWTQAELSARFIT